MSSPAEFASRIDRILEKNIPFICWFAPGSNTPCMVLAPSGKVTTFDSAAGLTNKRGFVFAPFAVSSLLPVILVEPELFLRGTDDIDALEIDALPVFPEAATGRKNPETALTEYINCINRAKSAIDSGAFSKVVFSKCSSRERQGESLGRLFLALQEKAPEVFVYIAHIPQAGLWMGATPETLLAIEGSTARTVSLAGTQPLRPDGRYCWFAKEIEEQAFVSRYAVDILNRYGVSSYTVRGPENLETTAVAHLKTTFFFSAANIADRLGEFIADLAPTPAVCGLPREPAREFILSCEPHNRKYYTGFLGPWNLADCPTHLFVNLRCMEVDKEDYILYTGGGITAKSSAADEWEETRHKAQTLLSVIDSLQGV